MRHDECVLRRFHIFQIISEKLTKVSPEPPAVQDFNSKILIGVLIIILNRTN